MRVFGSTSINSGDVVQFGSKSTTVITGKENHGLGIASGGRTSPITSFSNNQNPI